MDQKRFTLLGVPLDPLTQNQVLDKIKLYLSLPRQFHHIMSVNPENVVLANENGAFMAAYEKSDLALADGIGVVLGAKMMGFSLPKRVSGSVLLPRLLDLAGTMSSTALLIGSQANLALKIAQCYSRSYPEATFIGIQGYKNALSPTPQEEEEIESIVRRSRPHFVFVAFGSPTQELWIQTHRTLLEGCICMGVGGSFDYLSGAASPPPNSIRTLGLEWLYRLILQPWRIRRQGVRLPRFIGMILGAWVRGIIQHTHEKTPNLGP